MVRKLLAAVLAAGFLCGAPAPAMSAGDAFDMSAAVQLDDSGVSLVDEALSAVPVRYEYSDLYDIPAARARYQQASVANTTPADIIRDGRLEPQELFDTVRANNAAYLKNSEKYSAEYMEPSDEALMGYCSVIAQTVTHELAQGGITSTYDDLAYNLSHLTIFLAHTVENAAITEDGCMVVSPVNLENMKIISGNSDADKITIAHEAEHLLQKLSSPVLEAEGATLGYGYGLYFEDLAVNSLFHKWLFEAAAESLACACYDSGPITYQQRVGYLNSLTLALLPAEDFTLLDVERLTQQQDLEQVFRVFGCKTEAEQTELLDMLEAIDIILEDDADFWSLYQQDVLGRTASSQERAEVKSALTGSVCATLSKLLCRSLADALSRKAVPLSEVFTVLSVFEKDMTGHLLAVGDGASLAGDPFPEEYRAIQDAFFSVLDEALALPGGTVKNAYGSYGLGTEAILGGLTCLDNPKNAFFARMAGIAFSPQNAIAP